jgi:hypothetical protein
VFCVCIFFSFAIRSVKCVCVVNDYNYAVCIFVSIYIFSDCNFCGRFYSEKYAKTDGRRKYPFYGKLDLLFSF